MKNIKSCLILFTLFTFSLNTVQLSASHPTPEHVEADEYSANPILGYALRYLAKSFIKRTLKKQLNRNVKNKVARYGIDQVADHAVDAAFNFIGSNTSSSQRNHIINHWLSDDSDYHFDTCSLCNSLGSTIIQTAETRSIPSTSSYGHNSQNRLYDSERSLKDYRTKQYLYIYRPCQELLNHYEREYIEFLRSGKKRKAKKKRKEIDKLLNACSRMVY